MSHGWRSVLALLGLLFVSTAVRADVTSNFATGDDGWLAVVIDPATGAVKSSGPPTYNATGGIDGGWITMPDSKGDVEVYSAPAAYLGNQSAAYAGSLKFYALSTAQDSLLHPAVALVGNGLKLYYVALAPATTWTPYTIPLRPTTSWHVGSGGGPTPTVAEMRSVLSNLTTLYIYSEFINVTSTGGLTNVRLIPFTEGAYWNSPGPAGSEGACHIEGAYLLAGRSRPRLAAPVRMDANGTLVPCSSTGLAAPAGSAYVFALAPAQLTAAPAALNDSSAAAVLSVLVAMILLGGGYVAVSRRQISSR